MSAPINPLAVLEEFATRKNPFGDVAVAVQKYEQTRAAIAELIERERVMRAALDDLMEQCAYNLELGATGTGYWEDAQDTIDAALRAVGGAK